MTRTRFGRRAFHAAAAASVSSFALSGTASARSPASTDADLARQAVDHPDRLRSDRARDETRRPAKVLDFFDVSPGMKIADIQAGNGYYTELMSRVVGPKGQVYCVNDSVTQRLYGEQLTARLERKEFDASNVTRLDRSLVDMGLPRNLDLVLLVRFYHDFGWMQLDRVGFNLTVLDRLRPGGVFGVIDHHAKAGTGMSEGQRLHRVDAQLVRSEVEEAGFVLESESYILRDPTDGHDFNIFADNQKRRDRTDRFVYLFRKPE